MSDSYDEDYSSDFEETSDVENQQGLRSSGLGSGDEGYSIDFEDNSDVENQLGSGDESYSSDFEDNSDDEDQQDSRSSRSGSGDEGSSPTEMFPPLQVIPDLPAATTSWSRVVFMVFVALLPVPLPFYSLSRMFTTWWESRSELSSWAFTVALLSTVVGGAAGAAAMYFLGGALLAGAAVSGFPPILLCMAAGAVAANVFCLLCSAIYERCSNRFSAKEGAPDLNKKIQQHYINTDYLNSVFRIGKDLFALNVVKACQNQDQVKMMPIDDPSDPSSGWNDRQKREEFNKVYSYYGGQGSVERTPVPGGGEAQGGPQPSSDRRNSGLGADKSSRENSQSGLDASSVGLNSGSDADESSRENSQSGLDAGECSLYDRALQLCQQQFDHAELQELTAQLFAEAYHGDFEESNNEGQALQSAIEEALVDRRDAQQAVIVEIMDLYYNGLDNFENEPYQDVLEYCQRNLSHVCGASFTEYFSAEYNFQLAVYRNEGKALDATVNEVKKYYNQQCVAENSISDHPSPSP